MSTLHLRNNPHGRPSDETETHMLPVGPTRLRADIKEWRIYQRYVDAERIIEIYTRAVSIASDFQNETFLDTLSSSMGICRDSLLPNYLDLVEPDCCWSH